jgi:hypothetical protein
VEALQGWYYITGSKQQAARQKVRYNTVIKQEDITYRA